MKNINRYIVITLIFVFSFVTMAFAEDTIKLPTTSQGRLVGAQIDHEDRLLETPKKFTGNFKQVKELKDTRRESQKSLYSSWDYPNGKALSTYPLTSVEWVDSFTYEFFNGDAEKLMNIGTVHVEDGKMSFRYIERQEAKKYGLIAARVHVSKVVYEVYHFVRYEEEVINGLKFNTPIDFWAMILSRDTVANTDGKGGSSGGGNGDSEPSTTPKPEDTDWTIGNGDEDTDWTIGGDGSSDISGHDGWGIGSDDGSHNDEGHNNWSIGTGGDGHSGFDIGSDEEVGNNFTIGSGDEVGNNFSIGSDSGDGFDIGGGSSNVGDNFSIGSGSNTDSNVGNNFSIGSGSSSSSSSSDVNFSIGSISDGGSSSSSSSGNAGDNFSIGSSSSSNNSSSSSSGDAGNNFSIGSTSSSNESSSSSSSGDAGNNFSIGSTSTDNSSSSNDSSDFSIGTTNDGSDSTDDTGFTI